MASQEKMMDLEITENLPVCILSVSPLTQEERPKSARPRPSLKEIRGLHHRIAQLVAVGTFTQVKISEMVGVSPGAITRLKDSPAFRDLVEHYRHAVVERTFNVHDTITHRVQAASLELLDQVQGRARADQDRIDRGEKPEIPFGTIADVTMKMLDRAGIGPVKRQEQRSLSVRLTGDELQKIRSEARGVVFTPTADVELPAQAAAPEDRGAGMGEADSEGAVGEDEGERLTGTGAGL